MRRPQYPFIHMHWSKLFIPTLRDTPGDAEVVSHRLLLRAGYIRQLSPGIYSYLFLAQRSLLKIQRIVREEMNAIGAQEILLRARHGIAHEESMAALALGELRSYKQLPQIWYQIQTKFRDEPHPKSGVPRVRQFLMMDACSFDLNQAGLDAAWQKHYHACLRIFDRCGLQYTAMSMEFMVKSDAGEDFVVTCSSAGYAENLVRAVSRPVPPAEPDPEGDLAPEELHTPDKKTIADVAEFTGCPATHHIKSLVMVAGDTPYLLLLRGDHQLSESKFTTVIGAEARPAQPEEIREWFGADPGSLGPVGVKNMRVLADLALEGRRNMICGANRNDYHLVNVTPGKDFTAGYHDLRQVMSGDTHRETGEPLEICKAIEIGHIFKLGTRYSEALGLKVTNEAGEEIAPLMGSCGISVERILTAAVELYNDQDGMILPPSIAPFDVVITPVNLEDDAQRRASEDLYSCCGEARLDVLFDDRDERPGVKFKDADLIGIPYRIVTGKKLAQGIVEIVERRTKERFDVPIEAAAEWIRSRIDA